MQPNPRPLAVTAIAWLFLAVGVGTFAMNFGSLLARRPDAIWIELTESLAIVIGVFLLRGRNWARWLGIAWLGFHLAMTFVAALPGVLPHLLIFAGITWLLVRPESSAYFRPARTGSAGVQPGC